MKPSTTRQPPRLLVAGGNGFIGRHIANHAVKLGWDVTILDLSLRSPDQEHPPQTRCVTADITNGAELEERLKGISFEYVVNCSGYIEHTLFFSGGQKVFDTHFGGIINLVKILDRNVLKAFVNVGSSDEYGNTPAPQVETQRESPISPYSLGKVAATHFLQMLHRTENFPATTLRLFLIYGPGQDNRRFLPQIIRGCLNGQSFPTSAGRQLRDFCYIQDCVDAVFAALSNPIANGEVINIGSGQPVSIRQMIETINRLIGKGVPRFGKIAYRPGENMSLFADISKAKEVLRWEPKVTPNIGLERTIEWYKNSLQ